MRQHGCRRLDALFGRNLERAFERELNLARGFFACFPMCHNAGPFDSLGDEALVTFLRRMPDADFVVARIRLHWTKFWQFLRSDNSSRARSRDSYHWSKAPRRIGSRWRTR